MISPKNDNKAPTGEKPYCFGRLDTVFPMGPNGFRESPESCFPCNYKTACLRQAMNSEDGLKVRVEMVDRAYNAGWMGKLKRWSQRKTLNQQIKMKKERVDEKR